MRGSGSIANASLNSFQDKFEHQHEQVNSHFNRTLNCMCNNAFASVSDDNCRTFKDMMNQDDRMDFAQAVLKEIQAHEERHH